VNGYLECVKKKGYIWAHVKVCRPVKGDDFIFHRYPPEQTFLEQESLEAWYKKMLNTAISEGSIVDYKVIFECNYIRNIYIIYKYYKLN